MENITLAGCIDACLECAEWCNHYVSDSIRDQHAGNRSEIIQLNIECATICFSTAQMLSIGNMRNPEMFFYCQETCQRCATALASISEEQAVRCAAVCRRCAEKLHQLMQLRAA